MVTIRNTGRADLVFAVEQPIVVVPSPNGSRRLDRLLSEPPFSFRLESCGMPPKLRQLTIIGG